MMVFVKLCALLMLFQIKLLKIVTTVVLNVRNAELRQPIAWSANLGFSLKEQVQLNQPAWQSVLLVSIQTVQIYAKLALLNAFSARLPLNVHSVEKLSLLLEIKYCITTLTLNARSNALIDITKTQKT
jgi:hypothetical protein